MRLKSPPTIILCSLCPICFLKSFISYIQAYRVKEFLSLSRGCKYKANTKVMHPKGAPLVYIDTIFTFCFLDLILMGFLTSIAAFTFCCLLFSGKLEHILYLGNYFLRLLGSINIEIRGSICFTN